VDVGELHADSAVLDIGQKEGGVADGLRPVLGDRSIVDPTRVEKAAEVEDRI
jgi:hypothetical protein